MTALVWRPSSTYAGSIALTPYQDRTLALLRDLTAGGRRPELTVRELAARLELAVSTVHDAIGRLRALGLIGAAARLGRTGAHRFWRLELVADRPRLEAGPHRRAIARLAGLVRRLYTYGASSGPAPSGEATANPPVVVEPRYGPVVAPAATGPQLRPCPAPGCKRMAFGDRPCYEHDDDERPVQESFRDKLRRYGLGEWIDEKARRHDDER